MSYLFETQALDPKLVPQISKTLEKRTELLSRKQHPKLWTLTDKHSNNTTSPGKHSKLLSILCLLLGLFLFIPGLMKPQELLIPLIAGAVGIGTAIGSLIRSGRKSSPFARSAQKLLQQERSIGAIILFSDSGISLKDKEISYDSIESVIESKDFYQIVFGEQILILQKKELTDCEAADFHQFLSQKISIITIS